MAVEPDLDIAGSSRAPRPFAAERSPWLRGTARVPGDRGGSALVLALCAMARGESVIENLAESRATLAFIAALRALGVHIDKRMGRWHVQGIGVGGFLEPLGPLALTGAEEDLLLLGILGLADFPTRFELAAWQGPIQELRHLLIETGSLARVDGGALNLRGQRFTPPLELVLPLASASLKGALLLGALGILGVSRVTEPVATSAQTEILLRTFGAKVDAQTLPDGSQRLEIAGLQPLRAQAVVMPGDPLLAAYPLAAALIAPSSEIVVEAVPTDPARLGLLAQFEQMGGKIDRLNARKLAGVDVADFAARYSDLRAMTIPASGWQPETAPLLAVVAAFAEGDTLLETRPDGPPLHALRRALTANGVPCQETDAGFLIRGGKVTGGGSVTTRLDPALAMSFLVMGMATGRPVTVDDTNAIGEIFPDFVASFEQVGASLSRVMAP